jgi:hypothetical protein
MRIDRPDDTWAAWGAKHDDDPVIDEMLAELAKMMQEVAD